MHTLALLMADARLPVGAHTQSGGLEPALQAGMPIAAVLDFVRARLDTVTLVEAATAVLARRGGDLAGLDTAWRARTPSPALRLNSEQLARGYLRLVRRLWPDHPRVAAVRAVARPCRAVVVGVAAAAAGVDDEALARVVGYDDAQAVVAAALKVAPMDPLDATAWLVDLAPDLDRLARRAVEVTGTDDLPAGSAPEGEEWAERHAVSPMRLFRA